MIDEFFVRAQVQPRIVMETENVEIIKAMVASGIGSTLISNHAIDREVKAGTLVAHRLPGHPLVRETGWVYLKANRVPRKISEMIRVLDELLPKMGLTQTVAELTASGRPVAREIRRHHSWRGSGRPVLRGRCRTAWPQDRRARAQPRAGQEDRDLRGGRCNFTNLHCRPEHFLSNNPHFARSALARYQPSDFIALVERYGIAYHEKTLGQLFCDGSSRQIVDLLIEECRAASVELLTGCDVSVVRDGFVVETSRGDFEAPAVVVATGGLSIPKIGATHLGYRVARQFGVNVLAPRPALVPLLFDAGDRRRWRDLAGIAINCAVSVTDTFGAHFGDSPQWHESCADV